MVDRLSGEVQGKVHLAAHDAPGEIAPHHGELLLRSADPLAKLPRALKRRADLRRRVAAHGDIGGAKRAQDLKFQLIPRRAFGEGLQQRERAFQVLHRLMQRPARHRLHAGEPEILDGLGLIAAA